MKKYIFVLLMVCSLSLAAQDKVPVTEQDYRNNRVEMADAMRAEGKIYVVVAVLGVIFAGMLAYVVVVDRKVSRLEKEIDKEGLGAKKAA